MGTPELDATGAVALISSRGLDAAMRPLAPPNGTDGVTLSRLAWLGDTRTRADRDLAKAHAKGGAAVVTLERKRRAARAKPPASSSRTGGRR
jgi:hypothetical protein